MLEMDDRKVFIVDDEPCARDSLVALVTSLRLASECFANAEAFLKARQADRRRGCLIADFRLPGMSGLELQEELLEREDHVPLILVTGYGEIALAVRAIKKGAVTVLEKPWREHELVESIRLALQADADRWEYDQTVSQLRRRFDELSDKERRVMYLMLEGKPNKVIASKLDISQRTVETRRHHVFRKTGTKSVAELVRIAFEFPGALRSDQPDLMPRVPPPHGYSNCRS